MKVKRNWKRFTEVVSIQEFAQMDVALSTPDRAGFYTECVSVLIPSQIGTVIIMHIAKGEDGYHIAKEYETKTGGCINRPGRSSKAYLNKTDAFRAGLESLEKEQYVAFSKKYSDQAREMYFDAIHKQLTLF